MQAIFGKEQQIWPPHVVLAKNRVNIAEELAQVMLFNVTKQNMPQLHDHVRMIGIRTRAYSHLPIHKFQPHPHRVLSKLEELPRRHLGRADGGHKTARPDELVYALNHAASQRREWLNVPRAIPRIRLTRRPAN